MSSKDIALKENGRPISKEFGHKVALGLLARLAQAQFIASGYPADEI
jgi:hypothetical protein